MIKKPWRIVSVYDTETSNIKLNDDWRAFPILFIINDLTKVLIEDYTPDVSPEQILFYRHESEVVNYFIDLIERAKLKGYTPVCCAYNLMFDLQPILELLRRRYQMELNAQSTTNVYTLDLLEGGEVVLRFWDTFHLEMRGVGAMGRTCNFEKAIGSWNYDLVRTPETELTESELFYASRDVQVIPAYLRYLLDSNEWLTSEMLGSVVITKTSLVRQMAKREIGNLRVKKKDGRDISLSKLFETLCVAELPPDFNTYGLRKSCFRGGFTFTSAAAANRILQRVCSLDVTSMHHTFICGRRVPVHFKSLNNDILQKWAEDICSYSIEDVLENYALPFYYWFHARFIFKNIRLKKDSAFAAWHIGLLAQAKFDGIVIANEDAQENLRALAQDNIVRSLGWHDSADNPEFAFGKLMRADRALVHLSELELWNVSRVYEWDEMHVEFGEGAIESILPPDYVTLQSNILYERKNDAKQISKYFDGSPYTKYIPASIPAGIAEGLRTGTITPEFFASWYQSTVKGQFNGIYGTQAQDIYKPDFAVSDNAEIYINSETKTTAANWAKKQPKNCRVLYNYGLRIVGGSRMHLVIAIELLYKKFNNSIIVTGGDTDSVKVCCKDGITKDDLLETLQPLHVATRAALDYCQQRVRANYPELASNLKEIGEFDFEAASDSKDFYDLHFEAWNKARISIVDSHAHITCAGLSRPAGAYTIEDYIQGALEVLEPDQVLPNILGYNTFIDYEICHALEHSRPAATDVLEEFVEDYKGNTSFVVAHESIALYPSGRLLGDLLKRANADNVRYLTKIGTKVDTSEKRLRYQNGKPELWLGEGEEFEQLL